MPKNSERRPKYNQGLGSNIEFLNWTFHPTKLIIGGAPSFSERKIVEPKVVIDILGAFTHNWYSKILQT
jgi:hypothetical protein